MRLATVMMSLRLAGALTFAPEPIVIATSFSVRVWQICNGNSEVSTLRYQSANFHNKMDEKREISAQFTLRIEMQCETSPLSQRKKKKHTQRK